MYPGIFDDFNTIKIHCKTNGNTTFEESAVFELLENLFPHHGSAVAVQIIIDMLDAQRIRDFKDLPDQSVDPNECTIEGINSDKSNDNDSIIELEIPQKIHPVIDLTNNSPEANETTTIEKSVETLNNIESDLGSDIDTSFFGDDDFHDLSDSDLSKYFDIEWNKTIENVIKSRNELPIDCLGLNENPATSNSNAFEGDQNHLVNPNVIPEMLEENNNDPNNNLDDRVFNDPSTGDANINNQVIDIVPRTVMELDCINYNSNGVLTEKVIETTSGSSKDTDENIKIPKSSENFLNAIVRQCLSPVPGCSKDLDDSSHYDAIQDDAACIQEIIPWADLEIIHSILKKHSTSPNRKQLTLWDLMSEATTHNHKTLNKRKQENDEYKSFKKIAKSDTSAAVEESLMDIKPNIQIKNNLCNESSNDSQSSKISEFNENITENIQTNPNDSTRLIKNNTKFLQSKKVKVNNDIPLNKMNFSRQTVKVEKHCFNNFFNSGIPKNTLYNFSKFTDPLIKKERNETIVSGSLNENSVQQLTEKPSFNFQNFLKERTVIIPNLPNKNNVYASNLHSNVGKNTVDTEKLIKITEKEEENVFCNQSVATEVPLNQTGNSISPKLDKADVIKPAKLILQQDPTHIINKPSYLRPPTLNCINTNSEHKSNVTSSILNSEKSNLLKLPIPHFRSKSINISKRPSTFATNSKESGITHLPIITFQDQRKIKPSKIQNHCNTDAKKIQPISIIKPSILKPTMNKSESKITLKSSNPLQASQSVVQSSTSSETFTSVNINAFDQNIYSKLRSIFPDVRSSYIKKICQNPPNIINYSDKEYIMNSLIDHLLKEGHNHLRPVQNYTEQTNIAINVDDQYENLLGIFPDADPAYLRDFVEKNIDSRQVLEQFIQEKLETHDYPTKEQYFAKIKITEQIKQYTTDFNVEKFLELFPDPFQHFENKNRQCLYQTIGMEFLKSCFNKNKVSTISRQYIRNNHNISLTAKDLSILGPDMKSKRMSSEMPTENIPLLQELAFIKNKQNIQDYLKCLKDKEEQLFKELKEKNLLLTCQCCFNDECMPTKCAECNEGHVFCFDCIVRGTESTLADGMAHVRCFTECQSEFSLVTLQKTLTPTKFSALLKKRQTAEVIAAEIEGLVACPFCHFASIPPPQDKVFKCLNPECMKETCRQCKELNHIPLRCDEVIKSDKARLLIEEKMTEALIRTCYKCKRQFFKEEGCNKMKCPCGALMCYVCDKPVKDYKHFNAQGGENANLCPLWSDDRRINAQSVRKVAEEMKNAMLKINPNLKIDTESIMPKIPPKTQGPHDNIPNANQLPEHIRRVTGAAP